MKQNNEDEEHSDALRGCCGGGGGLQPKEEGSRLGLLKVRGSMHKRVPENAGCSMPYGFTIGAGDSIFHVKTLTLLHHSSAYTVRQATTHSQHEPMR
jgi:hypothetical protein